MKEGPKQSPRADLISLFLKYSRDVFIIGIKEALIWAADRKQPNNMARLCGWDRRTTKSRYSGETIRILRCWTKFWTKPWWPDGWIWASLRFPPNRLSAPRVPDGAALLHPTSCRFWHWIRNSPANGWSCAQPIWGTRASGIPSGALNTWAGFMCRRATSGSAC